MIKKSIYDIQWAIKRDLFLENLHYLTFDNFTAALATLIGFLILVIGFKTWFDYPAEYHPREKGQPIRKLLKREKRS